MFNLKWIKSTSVQRHANKLNETPPMQIVAEEFNDVKRSKRRHRLQFLT